MVANSTIALPGRRLHYLLLKFEQIFVAVINFSPFLRCRYFGYQLVTYCMYFQMIVKCLYRHLLLEDTSKPKKIALPNLWLGLLIGAVSYHPKFLWLPTSLSCDLTEKKYFYREAFQVMVIRRGDVTDISWVFAWVEIKCLISNQHFTPL